MFDRFGRQHIYLRVSVTDRCNLRCKYCMPAGGIEHRDCTEILSFEEIVRLVGVFAGLGVKKVRLTGGEPTVRAGIVDLVGKLATVPGVETLAMTTNGVLLRELAAPLHTAGVRLLNISLDSLKPDRYAAITGRDRLPDVLAGMEAALTAGFSPLKLNVVVMAGINDDELFDFAELAREQSVSVRFIEYMPFRGNRWSAASLVPFSEMRQRLAQRLRLEPYPAHGSRDGVAKDFRIDGFVGTINFITPLSDEFCVRCNRLRLTADGALKSCLFAPPELSLRDALRSGITDDELGGMILAALMRKPEAHPPVDILHSTACQAMTEIGG